MVAGKYQKIKENQKRKLFFIDLKKIQSSNVRISISSVLHQYNKSNRQNLSN